MSRKLRDHPIVVQTLTVNGLGVGLQNPLKVDALSVDHGDRLIIVADVQVGALNYPTAKEKDAAGKIEAEDDGTPVVESIVVDTLDAAVIKPGTNDGKAIKKLLADRRVKVQAALASMNGQETLDVDA